MTPFETVLGETFHHLQPQIRQLHGGRAHAWAGQVTVIRSGGLIGRLAGAVAGFPSAMEKAPFALRLEATDSGERWHRDFDGTRLRSDLKVVEGTLLEERFGPVSMRLSARVKADALYVEVVDARIFAALSLPSFATPRSDLKIWQDEAGRYRFDIKASFPMVGEVVRYHGWLRPAAASAFVKD